MDLTSYVTVIPITVICYLIGLGCKALKAIPDKWVPIIVGVAGGLLGMLGMFIMPEFPAADLITAAAVGVMSGLASTGVNQIYKQLKTENKNGV